MILKIAWRNVWRHPVRSLVIMSSVSIGIWAGLFLQSFYRGMGEQRVRSAIEKETSHLQIHHPEFKKDYQLRYNLPEAEKLIGRMQNNDRVKAITGRSVIQGMVSTASGSQGIMAMGIDPLEETVITKLNENVFQGTYFPANKKHPVLVSERLAQKLKLKTGGKLVFTFTDSAQNLTAGAFRVCGIFKTGNNPYDDLHVFIRKEDLNEIAHLGSATNEIALLLNSNDDTEVLGDSLKRAEPQLLVETWRELAPEVDYVISSLDQMVYIFMSIIFLALAFGIINTMLMSVLERTRELGMLLALGMNRMKVFSMILTETIFLVLAGSPAGLLFSFATISYFQKTGISFRQFAETFQSFGYAETIYPRIEPKYYLIILIMVCITALLAAIIPARKALKLKPSESIR